MLPTEHPDADTAVARIAAFFEQLTPDSVDSISRIYAPDARFKDPFNEVQGIALIQRVYLHMFESLQEPGFKVTGHVVQGTQCFLTWDFMFRFKRFQRSVPQTVRGASHLVLDAQGLITRHRDYWDAAEELYEKIPALGVLMRWLKKRANS
ncbi:nuclear transport factor 2 family protein [Rhodoferax sediminis]|uniref:Nuclear transport factor 2 family protein n=1 Tax=Rhodoferax sediminis TaxID=2509614 RepID=A0A515DDF2_9BURK|nr:nuclear transport factor 2 family protein [Rhodoferax sediminis]QDL38434.1 nuclear transport factor 2 family protein [Rhodoferax sediminis]